MGKLHYTIGTNKWAFSDWLETLKEHDITLVVDVRRNPWSHVTQYRRKELEMALPNNGIGYISLPDLGPTKKIRKDVKETGIWTHFESWYVEQLMYNDITRPIIPSFLDLLDDHVHCVLVCTETFPEKCHRRLLAEYISKIQPRYEFKHITPSDSGTTQEKLLDF